MKLNVLIYCLKKYIFVSNSLKMCQSYELCIVNYAQNANWYKDLDKKV